MQQSQQLANRFREVTLNGTWIANTNYKDQITPINWQQATTKISSLNTIALLTFHINYYIEGILQVFEGGMLDIRDKYSFDAPDITSETDWSTLKKNFITNSEKFAQYIEQLSDSDLESVFVDKKYGSYKRNIEAMIEHAYYHLGQISLIKKMIQEQG